MLNKKLKSEKKKKKKKETVKCIAVQFEFERGRHSGFQSLLEPSCKISDGLQAHPYLENIGVV